jgi:hypothetical protein
MSAAEATEQIAGRQMCGRAVISGRTVAFGPTPREFVYVNGGKV